MPPPPHTGRPPVSVVVPFGGDDAEARRMLAALEHLELAGGDELIVADNSPDGVLTGHVRAPVRRVAAPQMRSSYYARNVGAEQSANDWLLFLDADCVPRPSLLDDYFREPPAPGAGAVAGEVAGDADQQQLAARYSRSRRHIGQAEIRDHEYRPMAVTANLLVRRRAWEELGGFLEGVRSGGDADFSWRLQDAGWELGYAAGALVHHRHRETIRALARQSARYGAGMAWLRRRHPDAAFHGRLAALTRSAAGVVVWTLTARFERALFKALDGVWTLANAAGSLATNAAPGACATAARRPGLVLVVDDFPEPSKPLACTKARALERAGHTVRIEARRRALRPDRAAARGLLVAFREDEGPLRHLADLAWLVATRPLGCIRSRSATGAPLRALGTCARRIHRCGERELLAIAADEGAADAARLGRLLRLPVRTLTPPAGALERPGSPAGRAP